MLRDVEAATGLLSGGISHFENGRSLPTMTSAIILLQVLQAAVDQTRSGRLGRWIMKPSVPKPQLSYIL